MIKQIHHTLAKTPLLLRVVSLYVVIGAGIGSYIIVAPPVEAAPTSIVALAAEVHEEPEPVEPKAISGLPRKIELPRIGLALKVIDGNYDVAKQDWTLTDDKAQYATMTVPANDKAGQTMIYGHNTSAVLEPVRHVVVGDELLVTTKNDHTFVYVYDGDRYVEPTDVSVLYENPKISRLVLMTCEGWFSTTRRLLYFDFKEVR